MKEGPGKNYDPIKNGPQREVLRDGKNAVLCPMLDPNTLMCAALAQCVAKGFGVWKLCTPASYPEADKRSPACEVLK